MPRCSRFVRTAALFGALITLPAFAEDGPTTLDDRLAKGEVVVEFLKVENSPQNAMLATVVLPLPPGRVFALVDDCAGYSAWMPRVASASEVSRTGERSVCKWLVHLPFPFPDVSTEVAATSRRAAEVWTREFKQTHGDFQRNEGRWTLTAFRGDPQRTRLEYRLHVTMETLVPEAFVKAGQEDGVRELVKNLRERLEGKSAR